MSAPNLFIVGTTKGGTSTLHLWLKQHPDICLTEPKEIHYFCRCPNPNLRVAGGWDDYIGRFGDCRFRGEASPCYLYDRATAEALIEQFPGARFVVSLRDPVDRFWSHYLMNEIYRPTGLQPDEVLARNLASGHTDALHDLYGMGLFGRQLADYFDVIDRNRLHITFLERLADQPDAELERIFEFLEIPSRRVNTDMRDKQYVEPRGLIGELLLRNRAARSLGVGILPAPARRYLRTRVFGDPAGKPQLPRSLEERLRDLYTEDSLVLESLLGEALPWRWHKNGREGEDAIG